MRLHRTLIFPVLGLLFWSLSAFAVQGDPLVWEAAAQSMTAEMMARFEASTATSEVPPSLGPTGAWGRFQNQAFVRYLFAELPPLLERHRQDSAAYPMGQLKAELESKVRAAAQNPLTFYRRGSLFESVRDGLRNPHNIEGMLFGADERFSVAVTRFKANVERDRARFGADFFSPQVVAKGSVDVLGCYMQARLRGHEPADWDAMYAIGMLHPITDSVVDSGGFSRETFKRIMAHLKGHSVEPEGAYERLVFEFVDRIYKAFPKEKAPYLHWLLPRLLEEQLHSATNKPSDRAGILKNAFLRGGLSSLAFAYPTLGGLDEWEVGTYFTGGAIYQLLDDYTDIQADRLEGIPTVWTESEKRTGSISEALHGFFGLERHFELDSYETAMTDQHRATLVLHHRGFNNIFTMATLLNETDPAIRAHWREISSILPLKVNYLLDVIGGIRNVFTLTADPNLQLSKDAGFNEFIERSIVLMLGGEVPQELQELTTLEVLRRLKRPDRVGNSLVRGFEKAWVRMTQEFSSTFDRRTNNPMEMQTHRSKFGVLGAALASGFVARRYFHMTDQQLFFGILAGSLIYPALEILNDIGLRVPGLHWFFRTRKTLQRDAVLGGAINVASLFACRALLAMSPNGDPSMGAFTWDSMRAILRHLLWMDR